MQLDPVSAVARVVLVASLSRHGRFVAAIPHGRVAIDLAPANIGGPFQMAATLLAAGRWDAAEDYLAVVLNPEIASAIVASRRNPAARDAGLETIRRYEAQGMSAEMLAQASAWLGAVGPALTYLERAITERNFYVTMLFTNQFDLIRSPHRHGLHARHD